MTITPINGPDWFATLYDFADKHSAKVLLHKTQGGWAYVLTEKSHLHSGEAKGRNPREAAQALCQKLKLVPK